MEKMAVGKFAWLIFMGVVIAAFGLSWISTCGIIKLITICFGWTFKWSIATGIWLVLLLSSQWFKSRSNK